MTTPTTVLLTDGNGNGAGGGLFKTILSKYGFQGAVAAVFIYFFLFEFRAEIREMRGEQRATAAELTKAINVLGAHENTSAMLSSQVERLIRVQVQTCINQGRTRDERDRCVQ